MYYLCTRNQTMAGQLSWLERMIHNHEVPSSILGPATKFRLTVSYCKPFFVFLLFSLFCGTSGKCKYRTNGKNVLQNNFSFQRISSTFFVLFMVPVVGLLSCKAFSGFRYWLFRTPIVALSLRRSGLMRALKWLFGGMKVRLCPCFSFAFPFLSVLTCCV